jgi:predicted RND superfamily exporter protein
VVLCSAAIVIAAASFGLRRVTFDNDVTSLLPRGGRAVPAFRKFLQRFGSLDRLLIVFTAPEGKTAADYNDEIDTWIAALRRTPEIDSVDAGVAGPGRDWAWLGEHALVLMRDAPLDSALARLRPDGMREALAASRQLLSVPSPAIEQLVRQDPLDFFGLLREQLGGARAGFSVGLTEAGYVTPDKRHRLVVAKPKQPPYDTRFSRALRDRLEQLRTSQAAVSAKADAAQSRPPLDISFVGGHLIALDTEGVVKKESIWNSLGSLVLILPLLYVVFRSVWLFSCGALPSLISLAIVLGLMGLAGATLSAAATGAAAMLFGLGVDGVVLMYVAYGVAVARGQTGRDAVASLGPPSASMFLGMLTTAATFYGLVFVDFPALRQLGLLIGHSMVACGVLTLLLIPALLPHRSTTRGRFATLEWPGLAAWIRRYRGVLLGAAAGLTIVLAIASMRLHVNATLDRLKSTTPAAQAEERVERLFGLPSDIYVALQEGPELEPLLQQDEAFVADLNNRAPALAIDGASALLPSHARQAQTRARIRTDAPPVATALTTLNAASAEVGFRPGAFQPFVERLPKMLDADDMTVQAFQRHGLGDLLERFIVYDANGWTLASYAFPSTEAEANELRQTAQNHPAVTLTGLTPVNRELAAGFGPQFTRGLIIGSIVVLILIAVSFRDWRLSVLSAVPTAIGLIWTGGLLALAGISLDLFAVFAVVTFVGIGIDYGIHMVHRYQHEGDATKAIAQLAPVIVVAGVITLFGYGTLITSSYPPLQSMGIVSIVSVIALVTASVLVLPALLEIVDDRSPRLPRP